MFSKNAATTSVAMVGGALAILAGSLSAAPAHADAYRWPKPPLTRTERVFIGDLDLTAVSGRDTANTRIEGAVVRVCEPPSRFVQRREIRDCQRVARNGASKKMKRIVKAAYARAYARAD
jgi:UrcA family protein